MYEDIAAFYDNYGEREWERLGSQPYGQLIFNCHMWFLDGYLVPDNNVLDAGCGPGRFSIEAAKAGCNVTMLDMSQKQLDLAEDKMSERGLHGLYFRSSVTDMNMLDSNRYDVTICYGAVLNYLHNGASKAMSELVRVTKPGGSVFISVNSRIGVLRACASGLKMPITDFWGDPVRWGIYEVTDTGDEIDYPGAVHPKRHYFDADEVRKLMTDAGLKKIKLGAAPAVFTGQRKNVAEIYEDESAWDTLLRTESAVYLKESLIDGGEFIMARGVK